MIHAMLPARALRWAWLCCVALQAHAGTTIEPPDAGQTLRELQPPPAPEVPRSIPPLTIDGAGENQATSDIRFAIRDVQITGNSRIPTEKLRPLLADILGAQQTLAQYWAAARRISEYYRQHGYPIARAYLPAQEIRDGVLTIAVIEGRLDKRSVENHSRLSDSRVGAYLDRLQEGTVVRSAQTDRVLLLLNETPGVAGSRATLQPGASPGTSELLVTVDRGATVTGDAETDNYGNRYTGQYRAGGTLNLNSPWRMGDQFALNGLTSGSDLRYERASYQFPLGGDGLRLGTAYFDTHYRLGKEFSELQAHGAATGASLVASYPFEVTQRSSTRGTVSLEWKHLTDYADVTQTVTEKHAYVETLGLTSARRDDLGGGGQNSFGVSLVLGDLAINSEVARLIDDLTARTRGRYVRVALFATRSQRLTDRTSLSVTLSGQVSDKNLDSSEKFSLGGAEGVRAYPQGEGIGDEGVLANLELQRSLSSGLQSFAFYDFGSISTSHSPFQAATSNSRKLAGTGVGVTAHLAAFQVKAALAWHTQGGEPNSIPPWAAHIPTGWVQVRALF
jgi:hemolysin activation/secretion protein